MRILKWSTRHRKTQCWSLRRTNTVASNFNQRQICIASVSLGLFPPHVSFGLEHPCWWNLRWKRHTFDSMDRRAINYNKVKSWTIYEKRQVYICTTQNRKFCFGGFFFLSISPQLDFKPNGRARTTIKRTHWTRGSAQCCPELLYLANAHAFWS